MPGPFGFTYINKSPDLFSLDLMQRKLQHYPDFRPGLRRIDAFIAASVLHAPYATSTQIELETDDILVWTEGQYYNQTELQLGNEKSTRQSLPALLAAAYRRSNLKQLLRKIDGYFCAILYDRPGRKICLITDRYGLRPLYYYQRNNILVWATEVKGILAHPAVDGSLHTEAIQCFLEIGHLVGDLTLHQHISLVSPATLLIYDLETGNNQGDYYWTWADVPQQQMSFDEAVDQVHWRFQQSIRARFDPAEQPGVFLSGGLDSRYVLATVKELFPDYQGWAVTFGRPGCDDALIATQVADLANWSHREFHFTNDNWFAPRLPQILRLDGMSNMWHLHGTAFLEDVRSLMNVNLTGFLGDAVLRGAYLPDVRDQNQRIQQKVAERAYGRFAEYSAYDIAYYETPHPDTFFIGNRGRRFIMQGSINYQFHINQHKPFAANRLLELLYSFPDQYRADNRLYQTLLLRHHPTFFQQIPWQSTGLPLGQAPSIWRVFRQKCRRLPQRLGLRPGGYRYTNYNQWIRREPIRAHLQTACIDLPRVLKPYLSPARWKTLTVGSQPCGTLDSEETLRYYSMYRYLKNIASAA